MNSSYELRKDAATGSLEPGELADLIILDRNVLEIPADQIADTKVMQTVVVDRIVYTADGRLEETRQSLQGKTYASYR